VQIARFLTTNPKPDSIHESLNLASAHAYVTYRDPDIDGDSAGWCGLDVGGTQPR
jgi:hypothetical protein